MFTLISALGLAAILAILNIYMVFFADYRDVESMFDQKYLIGKIGVRVVYPIPAIIRHIARWLKKEVGITNLFLFF